MLRSSSFCVFGDNHSQRAPSNPVVKGSFHHLDLAVKSNPHAFSSCLYVHLVRQKREEIFVVAEASDYSTQGKTYQLQATCSMCYVNTEFPSIETIAQTDIE